MPTNCHRVQKENNNILIKVTIKNVRGGSPVRSIQGIHSNKVMPWDSGNCIMQENTPRTEEDVEVVEDRRTRNN